MMMRNIWFTGIVVGLVGPLLATQASAQCSYTLREIAVPLNARDEVSALNLTNDQTPEIAGVYFTNSSTSFRGFISKNGMAPHQVLDATMPLKINPSGDVLWGGGGEQALYRNNAQRFFSLFGLQITGMDDAAKLIGTRSFVDGDHTSRIVGITATISSSGRLTYEDIPIDGVYSVPQSIANNGYITGQSYSPDYSWMIDGRGVHVNSNSAENTFYPRKINNSGLVAGYRYLPRGEVRLALWNGDVIRDLHPVGAHAAIVDFNNLGDILLNSDVGPSLLLSNGKELKLRAEVCSSTLVPQGATFRVNAINDRRVMVGDVLQKERSIRSVILEPRN